MVFSVFSTRFTAFAHPAALFALLASFALDALEALLATLAKLGPIRAFSFDLILTVALSRNFAQLLASLFADCTSSGARTAAAR